MTMFRNWDPFREFDRLFDDVSRAFGRSPLAQRALPGQSTEEGGALQQRSHLPAVDIHEDAERVSVRVDLPGVKKNDVQVDIDNGVLSIRAERKSERTEDRGKVHLEERVHGVYQRSFRLPDYVDGDKCKAKFEDGVLSLTLPKREESRPKRISVDVK